MVFLNLSDKQETNNQEKSFWVFDDVKTHVSWETPRGRYDVVQQQFSLISTKVINPVRVKSASEGCQRHQKIWHGAMSDDLVVDVDLHKTQ